MNLTPITLLPGVLTPAEEELAVLWMEETAFQAHRAYVEAHLVPDPVAEATFITAAKFVGRNQLRITLMRVRDELAARHGW